MSVKEKQKKVAVIGGGTAGYMAAAHITKHFPCFDLYHIYDSRIPTIGVGEGTQANFPDWLEQITGLDFDELQQRCYVTRKFAIQFENWGTKNKQFLHNFHPIKKEYGYHISAKSLVNLLEEHVSATRIDKKIIDIKSDGISVHLTFEDLTKLDVDLAFDASGFPKALPNSDSTEISLIPTNAALIHRGSAVDFNSATRSIARPYGWIFIIPLTTQTSYGYVYNNSINSISEIEADLNQFLQEENVKPLGEAKHLTFPNFMRQTFFDGSLFKLGNAASFLEPLEATALGVTLAQICYGSHYLKELSEFTDRSENFAPSKVKASNEFLTTMLWKVALFVGWHYACGSCFDTEFWHFAKSNFNQEMKNLKNETLLRTFKRCLEAGSDLNTQLFFPKLDSFRETFAGFTPASFCEIGYGIGYYS